MPNLDLIALTEASKKAIGTPWRHAGRDLAQGVDCLGLVVCALREAGADVADSEYEKDWWEGNRKTRFQRAYHEQFEVVSMGAQKAGDVVALRMSHAFTDHVGLMLDRSRFLHAGEAFGVRVSRLSDPHIARRISAFYHFTGSVSRETIKTD